MPEEKKQKLLCVDNIRHSEYYGMQEKFDELYRKSANGEKFNDLMNLSEVKTYESKESDVFLNARNALMECGKVLREDRESNIAEGIIYAGVGNMNPSIVVISVSGKKITIAAYAKEGLINQHTAKKAIERYSSVL